MGVPKGKTSKANKRMNRAARYTIDGPALATCSQCQSVKQPHAACPTCGFYKGHKVLTKTEE